MFRQGAAAALAHEETAPTKTASIPTAHPTQRSQLRDLYEVRRCAVVNGLVLGSRSGMGGCRFGTLAGVRAFEIAGRATTIWTGSGWAAHAAVWEDYRSSRQFAGSHGHEWGYRHRENQRADGIPERSATRQT